MPPTSHITRSKTINETISLIADFRDFLVGGEVRVGQTVSVEVFTGDDPAPEAILYQGITITQGAVLEQRFKEGLPGVIYSILFTLTTDADNTYEWKTRLAVLPNTNTAVPVFDVVYLTSMLYPIPAEEWLQTSVEMQSGLFWFNPTDVETLSTSINMQDGFFYPQLNPYTLPPSDFLSTAIAMQDGELYPQLVSYTLPPSDFVTTNIAMLDGTWAFVGIYYTLPPSDFVATNITMLDGTLE